LGEVLPFGEGMGVRLLLSPWGRLGRVKKRKKQVVTIDKLKEKTYLCLRLLTISWKGYHYEKKRYLAINNPLLDNPFVGTRSH